MTNDQIAHLAGCPVCRAPRTIPCSSPAPHTARLLLAYAYEEASGGAPNVPLRGNPLDMPAFRCRPEVQDS